jgi:hypothetical protein
MEMNPQRTRRGRRLLGLAATAVATGALAAPAAQAGLLTGKGAAYCPLTTQAFGQWGDSSYYRLAAGGSFEGTVSWTISGGAGSTAGNEPFYANAADDTQSLLLPAGAVATSPASCVDASSVKLRLFTKGTGRVRVSVVSRDLLGVLSVLDGGVVTAGTTWEPSPEISMRLTSVGALLTINSVQVRVTAVDGPVQVDDVFIDPFKST